MKILKAITDFIFVEDEHGIKRVLGEVKKCGKYFSGYIKDLLIKQWVCIGEKENKKNI